MKVLSSISAAAVLLILGTYGLSLREDPSVPIVSATETRLIVVASDGSISEAVEVVSAYDLVGQYYCGDGLGYNLLLTLDRNGRFECIWSGCLGVYGESSGRWTMDHDGLKLLPRRADGMFEDRPLGRLFLIQNGTEYLLLQEDDRDSFEKKGLSDFWCLRRR